MAKKSTVLSDLYRAWKAAESAWKAAQSGACAGQEHGTSVPDDNAQMTVVIGTTRKADVTVAKDVLSPARYRAVTRTVVDLPTLDAMRKDGRITEEQYSAIVTEKDNAPYLKVTLR